MKDHPPSNLLARPFSDGEFYATRTSKVVGDMKLRDERAFVITRFFCVVSTRFVCVDCYALQHIFFTLFPWLSSLGDNFCDMYVFTSWVFNTVF